MSEIEELRKSVKDVEAQFEDVENKLRSRREKVANKFKELLDEDQAVQIYPEHLEGFWKQPWGMIHKKGHQWYVFVPRFVKFAVGWLDHSTESYNVFIVSKYTQWFNDIPSDLLDKLKFPAADPFQVFDGMLFTGIKLQEKAWEKYHKFLWKREGKDRIRIKKGWEFKLIAQLLEDGTLPFVPTPVAAEDLREWSGDGRLKYDRICHEKGIKFLQDNAWNEFKARGAVGVYWAFGAGKSLFGHRLVGSLKGPKVIVIPTLTLKEQWLERLDFFNPHTKDEVQVATYHAYEKLRKKKWALIIFDECQHLPARTFIRLSTIQAKYRAGFTGSPFREDGRENYIIALTGHPIGMSWDDLLKLKIVTVPTFRIYILRDARAKDQKLEELLRLPLKTIVFCDSLDYGEHIKKRFEIPFVSSKTRNRLQIIRESETCVVSRVGDEGISDPNLERIIEVAFLFGSRMQESQRFGRLMHSTKKAQHIILMTNREYNAYHKRLNAILSRGFRLEYIWGAHVIPKEIQERVNYINSLKHLRE